MKFNLKLKAVGAVVAALVAGALPTAANADAIAQSILNITNFTFRVGNNAAGLGGALPGTVNISATTTADAFAELEGFGVDTGAAFPGGEVAKVGPGVYTPGVRVLSPNPPTGTYAGSFAAQTGNAVTSSATALTDNTVSLKPFGDGTAQGNVNLNSEFTVDVAVAGTKLEVKFDAESFLRAYLTDPGTSTAAYSWVMTLVDVNQDEVFSWTPNGTNGNGVAGAGNITGGTEYADAFRLTTTRSILSAGDVFVNNATAGFEAETDGLAAGRYKLSIRQTGTSDARLLPEPGTLALLGTLLAGAALTTRRRNAAK